MTFTVLIALVLWFSAIAVTLWGTWITLQHFSSSPPHLDAPFGLYPVSILKPFKGAEPGMEENLESFFRLEYPDFEILFSVADGRDPGVAIVRKLIQKYPGVRALLIIGDVQAGPNPKVNNLVHSYQQAANDLLLISDSNVRVESAYLKRMVAHLDNGVGVITAVVAGRNASGLGGHLEATFLNSFYSRGMMMANATGRPCVIGKSMLFRRSTANRFGGIKTLARYLAEDYMTGEAMRKLGLQVVTTVDPVPQHIGEYTFNQYWSRHLRWGRIRKSHAPITFFMEPWFGALSSGIFGAFAFASWLNVTPSSFMAMHLLFWAACDALVMRKVDPRVTWQQPLAWFLREFLAFPLWFHIACGNTVNWRGQKLRLLPGGVLEGHNEAS